MSVTVMSVGTFFSSLTHSVQEFHPCSLTLNLIFIPPTALFSLLPACYQYVGEKYFF